MKMFVGNSSTVDIPQNILGKSSDHKTSSCANVLHRKKTAVSRDKCYPATPGATDDNIIVYVPGVKLPG